MENSLPLVSVCVICYNSSETVVETLESIKNQSYNNIELIVTDDCSTDNTVDVCREWIEKNGHLFANAKVIESDINTGMSANYNRAIKQVKGLWVKTIDGDDTLKPNCISDFIDFVTNNTCDIAFSKMQAFGDGVDNGVVACKDLSEVFKQMSDQERLIVLTRINYLPSPSSFIKTDLFSTIGLYDERIPFIEDWPFWLKASNNGCSIKYFDKDTVNYRIHRESVSQKKSTRISQLFADSRKKATLYAYEIGGQLGLFERLYYSILAMSLTNDVMKYATVLNVFNPFAYKFLILRKRFNKLINK